MRKKRKITRLKKMKKKMYKEMKKKKYLRIADIYFWLRW